MNDVRIEEYHPYRKDLLFKVVLLKTGEKILCMTENEIDHINKNSLTMIEPTVIQSFSFHAENGTEHRSMFQPWMNLSDNDEFVLPTDLVITMGDMRPDVREQYARYVENIATAKSTYRKYREEVTINDVEEKNMNDSIMELLSRVSPHPVRFVDE